MNWASIIAGIGSLVMTIIKALFGTDKPQEVITDEAAKPIPTPTAQQVLRDLGVDVLDGAPVELDDVERVHAGADRGDAVRDRTSRAADPDTGEYDSVR